MVITGASSGIGLVTARLAAKSGAAVFLISRNAEVLCSVCNEIEADGGRAGFAVADVGDTVQLSRAAAAATERFGGFDTWVNVAGVAIASPLLSTPQDEHERLFRTNYWGVVNSCTLAMEHLRQKGGALITVGSVASDIGTPVLGAYAASKHAVKGYVDSLRIELIADHVPVSVTLIKPSGIGTPLGEHTADHMPGAAKVPPPAYPPESVAKAILAAAVSPRREIIVGGVGALQILGARLMPRMADWISSKVTPLLFDRHRQPSVRSNLFAPEAGGSERSLHETSLPGSFYTAVITHRRLSIASLILGCAVVLIASQNRRTKKDRGRPLGQHTRR